MLSEQSTNGQLKEITAYFKEQITDLNVDIAVNRRDSKGNIVMFEFLTQFAGENHFAKRFTRTQKGSFEPYRIQYIGNGKLMVAELGDSGNSFIITKNKLQIMKAEKKSNSTEKLVKKTENPKDKAFRFEIAQNTTEPEMEALTAQLKEEYNIQFKYAGLKYNDDGIITAISLEMKDLGNKNVSKLNLKNTEGLGTIILFRSEEGALGFKSATSSSSTTTSTTTNGIISGSGSLVNDSLARMAQMTAMEEQKQALEYHKAAMEEQKAALEIQRNMLDEQQKILEMQHQEMDKFMQEQENAMKNRPINALNQKSNPYSLNVESLERETLILVDGEEMSKSELKLLDTEKIESINIFKDAEMMKKYGAKAKGKDGVMDIKLIKENKE